MKPAQGSQSSSAKSAQMVIFAQVVVLFVLLTSTVMITRVIVLGGISEDSFNSPEFKKAALLVGCPSRRDNPANFKSQGDDPANYTAYLEDPANYIFQYDYPANASASQAAPANFTSYREALDTTFELDGYILSTVKARYGYASTVLAKLNITAHHYQPLSYKSQVVYDEMEKFHNSTMYHGDPKNLKMFSHRMAHTGMLFDFVNDQKAKMNSWRFIFEDDIEIHPDVAVEDARDALAKGLELGSGDGIVFLGICGPAKVVDAPKRLAVSVVAKRTYGTCTHAYGVTKWRAAGILSHLDKIQLPSLPGDKFPGKGRMFYDVMTRAYGSTVTKSWVLGMNLKSPVPKLNHWGLIYQDRIKYPSFISAPRGAKDISDPN